MADLTLVRDSVARSIVITDDLEVFGITCGSVLLVDSRASPQNGDLVCVEYRSLLVIGLIFYDTVFLPECEVQAADCKLLGVIIFTPQLSEQPSLAPWKRESSMSKPTTHFESAQAMRCPRCKLINPDTALWCDCGYDFSSGEMREPEIKAKKVKLRRSRWLLLYLAIACAEAIFVGIKDGLGDEILMDFIPSVLGGALSAYLIGCLVGAFAKRENRFQASAGFSLAFWLVICIGRSSTSAAPDHLPLAHAQSANTSQQTPLSSPAAEFIDGGVTKFSTKGHSKSKGAFFSIKYPQSWSAKEGERPNIVQKFVSESGKGLEMVMILTKSFPANIPVSKADIEDLLSQDGLKEWVPRGATLIRTKSTKIEGEPAGIVEYSQLAERAGIEFFTQAFTLVFVQGRTIVGVQMQIGGLSANAAEVAKRADAFRILFHLMMNSIVFEDKWK